MFPDRHPRSFLDHRVLSRLAGFPLFARRPMQGTVSGRHSSPHRGSSVEFAEYRKYVAGDDLRRLDWRAYGRSDRFYVKEFEADTNLRCCFVVDTSGSMGFGSKGITKLEYARRMIETMGDTLSADPQLVMRHMVALQSVDIAGQILGHIANVIRSSDPEGAVELIGMCDLRGRLKRAGGV